MKVITIPVSLTLGNIRAGHKVSDTYVALKLLVAELIKKNILPVIIGGGQDLTYPQFMAYEELEQKVDSASCRLTF
jgi:formiminoglutamase